MISIIIAVRNEEKHLGQCIESLLNQTYKDIEIIIVDGTSDDNTVRIAKQYERKNPNVFVFVNPAKRVAEGRNIGYNKARGEYIGFIDGHSYAKNNWIETLYKTLQNADSKVGGVGSVHQNAGNEPFAIATTLALQSRLGGGNSSYRATRKLEEVQTAYAILYKKKTLYDIKKNNCFYNPYFVKGQDAEMNIRIIKKGYKILRNPKAITYYYKRSNIKGFWNQMKNAGFWRLKILKEHPETMKNSLGFFVPLSYFILIIILGIIHMISGLLPYAWAYLAGIYLGSLGIISLTNAIKKRDFYYLITGLLVSIIHIGYSWGLVQSIFKKELKIIDRVKQ